MDFWSKGAWKPLFVPGGVLWLATAVLLEGKILPVSASGIDFLYYAIFGAGILLAWRFHSGRVFFALLIVFLSYRALGFFSTGHGTSSSAGRTAFEAVALLLPLNFVVLSAVREQGLALPAVASRAALLFVESVFVAVICRPGDPTGPDFLHAALLHPHLFQWTKIPQLAWLAFLIALAVLLARFVLYRKPVESGLLWSLVATFFALQHGGVGHVAGAYMAAAGLILASSIVENSYVLAYHDELTSLPARRAFNDALLRLQEPYAVAAVDIDHFKAFNDNYGHETGDQVLRMVAAKLERVGGGGLAFRVGGEEFSILFPGDSLKDAVPHLELLRAEIEMSSFRVRGVQERRSASQGRDRRRPVRRKALRFGTPSSRSSLRDLSVTVSIGVAESTSRARVVERVIQAADKALYRAKQAGRNRVETATSDRARLKRSIA